MKYTTYYSYKERKDHDFILNQCRYSTPKSEWVNSILKDKINTTTVN